MPKNTEPKHTPKPQHQTSDEGEAWLDMALDQAAFAAFQSWEQVRDWLATPNPQLDGVCPEDAARNPDGLNKVMSILMMAGGQARDDFMREAEKMPVQERDALNGLTDIKSLKGMFGRPSLRVSIEDMNAAIARHGAKKK